MWAVRTSVVAHDSISSKTVYDIQLLIYGEKSTCIVVHMTILWEYLDHSSAAVISGNPSPVP